VWRDRDEHYWLEGPTREVYTGVLPLAASAAVSRDGGARMTARKV
jgi:hypothetical protein